MTRILICALAGCLAVPNSAAQERSSYLTLSSGVTITKYSEGIHKYSGPGWGLGVGFAHDVNDYARLVVEGAYQRFGVEVERVYSHHPNTGVFGGLIRSRTTEVYEGSVGFILAFTANVLRPYVAIGGGVMFLKRDVLGFVSFGLGLEFPLAEFLSASVDAKMSTPFTVEGVTVPITVKWYLRL